jgi:hypothetical protein
MDAPSANEIDLPALVFWSRTEQARFLIEFGWRRDAATGMWWRDAGDYNDGPTYHGWPLADAFRYEVECQFQEDYMIYA